jgi:hypothetical protein
MAVGKEEEGGDGWRWRNDFWNWRDRREELKVKKAEMRLGNASCVFFLLLYAGGERGDGE